MRLESQLPSAPPQASAGSIAEEAWKVFLNYDGAGGSIAGSSSVEATSADTPAVGAYAFLDADAAVLRVLLTGKQPQGGSGSTAALSVAWPEGTPAGSVVAQLYGLSSASPALTHLGNASLACGAGAQPSPVTLPPWSLALLVMPYACSPA